MVQYRWSCLRQSNSIAFGCTKWTHINRSFADKQRRKLYGIRAESTDTFDDRFDVWEF